jgi:hypothetical protein
MAPYCDVDLNPKWKYDLEKATFLNCAPDDRLLSGGAIAGIVVAGVVVVGLALALFNLIRREKAVKPVFAPSEKAVRAYTREKRYQKFESRRTTTIIPYPFL